MRHWITVAIDFYNKGKINEAKKLFLKVIKRYPEEQNTLNYLSIISFQQKDYPQSKEHILAFLKQRPKDPTFLNRLGTIQLIENDLESAEKSLRLAITAEPDFSEAHFNLSRVLLKKGRIDEAKISLTRVLALKPDHTKANELIKKIDQSASDSTNTLKSESQSHRSLKQLGESLLRKRDFERALPVYQQLINIIPNDYNIVYNLGMIYFSLYQYDEALPFLKQAKEIGNEKALNALLYYMYAKISICDWTDYDEDVKELITRTKKYLEQKPNFQIPVYILNYFDIPRRLIAETGWHQSRLIARQTGRERFPERVKDGSGRRLRIGYISTKFKTSPGGVLLHRVFQYHDREKFKIIGYSLTKPEGDDFFTAHFKDGFDNFRDISAISDSDAAKLIYNDNIDILIALAGYEDDMRLAILAMRPAPIQINWAGYHESIGSDLVQFSILDKTLKTGDTSKYYTEGIIDLPGCALFNSQINSDEEVSKEAYGLPNEKFIYACLNHPKKITPREIKVWSTILRDNSESVLWLYDAGEIAVINNLQKAFHANQINEDRIIFCSKESVPRHWQRLTMADLFLDTFIYNAHVTAIESLRMGTPILSLEGTTNYSRLGKSILEAAGLPELVCKSEQEYIDKALALALDNKIEGLKSKLSRCLNNEILFDTITNVQNLESALLDLS